MRLTELVCGPWNTEEWDLTYGTTSFQDDSWFVYSCCILTHSINFVATIEQDSTTWKPCEDKLKLTSTFFKQRIVSIRNKLDEEYISLSPVNSFKGKLQKSSLHERWRLDAARSLRRPILISYVSTIFVSCVTNYYCHNKDEGEHQEHTRLLIVRHCSMVMQL